MQKPTVIVIVGPTASGKSNLAVRIAKTIDGEIISADSRQVYKGMDIGSGKITKREMKHIPHYLLDVANPKRTFTVSHYTKLARHAIKDILERGKTPIIVGGTGLYIRAVVEGIVLPPVPPNIDSRTKLNKVPPSELFTILLKIDPGRAKTIDPKNPHRLIRAIEIATALGAVPPLTHTDTPYSFIMIGLKPDDQTLKDAIHKRLETRLRKGMIAEVISLHNQGLSWKRLENFGLEYRYIAEYLQKKIDYSTMKFEIETKSWHYAKRQMTWFKRDKQITWYKHPDDVPTTIF